VITLDALNDLSGIRHAFFTRQGGVSTGLYASLNCGYGSGDAPEAVAENRARAAARLGVAADRLSGVYQVHSATCVTLEAPIRRGEAPRADAMVTRVPGLALGILSADCAPVLFADAGARVIGAAHAGWKGALAGVTDAALAAMEALGASRERIHAAVGPCIARTSYEVDDAFAARFRDADPANERFFTDGRAGHPRFDLEAYVTHRLAAAGVGRVEALGLDTYANEPRFYSYRRATHQGEPSYGRQISLIGVPAG
jgi:polyphenol oxidase